MNIKNAYQEYYNMGISSFPVYLRIVNGKKESVNMLSWKDSSVVSYNSVNTLLDTGKYNGLAIITGESSNILVLDIDNKGIADDFLRKQDITIPTNTPFVSTQGGGVHYYFSFPSELSNVSTTKSFKEYGFDTRGNGGIIYAPPTVVEGGGSYHWHGGNTPKEFPPPPKKLCEFLLSYGQKLPNRAKRGVSDVAFIDAASACEFLAGKITSREKWLQVGRALTEMGEQGRSLFQIVTCNNPNYPDDGVDVANKKFDDLLRNTDRTRIETLYFTARELGWKPPENDTLDIPYTKVGGIDSDVEIKSNTISMSADDVLSYACNGTLGLAELGVVMFKDKYVYDTLQGTWRAYKNGVWSKRDKQAIIVKIATKIARVLKGAIDNKLQYITGIKEADEKIARQIKIIEQARQNILRTGDVNVCKKMEGMMYAGVERLFDDDPYLLNVLNGVINLRTFKLLPHSPDYLMGKQAPVVYDPTATAPFWDSFMSTSIVNPFVYGDNEYTDHETIGMLKRYTGTSLVGEVMEQGLVYLQGGGGNGKSTFTNTISRVLGDYGNSMTMDAIITDTKDNNKFNLAHLPGVRGIIFDEIERGKYLAESTIKTLTSGSDEITAAFKGRDIFSFVPQGSIFLQGNNEINIRSQDEGIWRRIHRVMWNHSYTDASNKGTLLSTTEVKDRLSKETSGILNWMLQGLKDYQAVGLNPSPNSTRDTMEYRDDNDIIGSFLKETVDISGGCISRNTLYKAYRGWCDACGRKPLAQNNFTREVHKTQFFIKGRVSDTNSMGVRNYKGIAFKDGKYPAEMEDLVRPVLGTQDVDSLM